jgi:hypothetical protein
MPLEDPFALKIFENGKEAMTIEFANSLISIIFKHVDNIEIRNNIFEDFVKKYPNMKPYIENFIYKT